MRFLLYMIFAITSLIGYSSADDGKPELSDASKQVVAKIRQLRDQEESELKKIAGKEERDLVKAKVIEAEVKSLKAAIARPKRDALSDLFTPKPLTKPATKAQGRAAKARRARKARKALRQRRRAAANRLAKLRRARRARAHTRARALLRLKRAKAQKRAAAARRAAQERE